MYDQNRANEYHEMLKQKYGRDIAFYHKSVNAMMDHCGVDPTFAQAIKEAVDKWYDTSDRLEYYVDDLGKKLYEINDSEAMHKLVRDMKSYAYHLDEGPNI